MTENIAPGAFTYVTRSIASVLITPIFICAAYDPQGKDESTFRQYSAIWDTGATKTMVTQHVAKDCRLVPTAQSRVRVIFCPTADCCRTGKPDEVTILVLDGGSEPLCEQAGQFA